MGAMPHFLVEIHMNTAGHVELQRAARTLDAAGRRLRQPGSGTPRLAATVTAQDGRLVCRIDAPNLETARRLLGTALLTPARVCEIPDPAGDPDSGAPVA